MQNKQEFYESVYRDYESNPNKNVVLMAGPSSSGKGVESKNLAEYFRSQGKNVIVVEADNYYKGIARIIVEKALMKAPFERFKQKTDKITKLVRGVIEESPFPDKFSEPNYQRLMGVLRMIFGDDTKAFVDELKFQKEHINFDEPFAINFNALANDVNKLSKGESIKRLSYSFDTGETTYTDAVIDAEGNDVVIVEGLYALRDELLNNVDVDKTIRCGISCDIETLMSRRFDRDIRGGRSTLTPEQTIEIFINVVMPAYFEYILPSIGSHAEHILDVSLTKEEIGRRDKSSQIKFSVSDDVNQGLNAAKFIKKEEQVDYFFEGGGKDNGITLRVRCVDGLATQICLKVGDRLEDRPVDEYNLEKLVLPSKRCESTFVGNLIRAGLRPIDMLRKTRSTYLLDGKELALDNVDGVGSFIEFKLPFEGFDQEGSLEEAQTLIDYVSPYNEVVNGPYIAIVNDCLGRADKKETEMKFKLEISDQDFGVFTEGRDVKNIAQYYLDKDSKKVQGLVNAFWNGNIDLEQFAEARIRIVNNQRAYLTLKSAGTESRVEVEKELPIFLAKEYVASAVNSVEKVRYVGEPSDNGLVLEVDDYTSSPELRVVEVEYDPTKVSPENVKAYVSGCFDGVSCKLTDVTNSPEYKNGRLAARGGDHSLANCM